MARAKRVQEVVSHPYSVETAFHRAAGAQQVSAEWILEVLSRSYGLTAQKHAVRSISLSGNPVHTGLAFLTADSDPFLLVCLAAPGEVSDAELALRQSLLSQHTASYGLVTDGEDFVFLRRRHDADRCDYASDLPKSMGSSGALSLFPVGQAGGGTEKVAGQLELAFFDAHCAIRDVEGMHDDEALDELCKLLFTILSPRAERAKALASPEQHPIVAASTIRGLYLKAAGSESKQSSGDAFSAPIRLSDASLLKAWRSLNAVDVASESGDLKGRAFQRILDPAIRAGMGQYFTPDPVVEFMVNSVAPGLGESILDPFCGSGHFLARAVQHVAGASGQTAAQVVQEWSATGLHGIEKSERMVRIARTDQMLSAGAKVSIHRHDALAPFGSFASLRPGTFDIVLTNPPFGSLLSADAMDSIGPFALARAKGTTPVDVLGLERSIQFLKPGGRLAIVLPEGVFSNQRMRHVREWLDEQLHLIALVALPVCTFAPYGANVRTAVLFGVKKSVLTGSGVEHVIVAGSDSVGYDASGKATPVESDLHELSKLVAAAFKEQQGGANVA